MIKDSETPIPMQQGGVVVPEGVSFDGVTDYLSRSSDLVGNTDSKTFTFSCWVYYVSDGNFYIYQNDDGIEVVNLNFYLTPSTGTIHIVGYNNVPSYQEVFGINTAINGNYSVPQMKWTHIILSVDINSAIFKLVADDVDITSGTYSTFPNNVALDLSGGLHYVFGSKYGASTSKGRLSSLFLDYTYRDLSIEANRRLFITEDGKPADGLASLNPILYLPMKDAATAHINLGTGGNFVQNGTLATVDVGANQDQCKASYFDGVDDYLSSTGIGAADSKQLLLSCIVTPTVGDGNHIFSTNTGNSYFQIFFRAINGAILIVLKNEANIEILRWTTTYTQGTTFLLQMCIDMTNESSCNLLINNKVISVTQDTFTLNGTIGQSDVNSVSVGSQANVSNHFDGSIGELYFDTNYIDLATNNPFWDSDTNKPIPVRTAMANLGSNPLICMPIDASNPTKNYGSGGDFTLNGGGLVGARGASEYIARSGSQRAVNYAPAVNYLSNTQVSTNGAATALSGAIAFKKYTTTWNNSSILSIGANGTLASVDFSVRTVTDGTARIYVNGTPVLSAVSEDIEWNILLFYYNGSTLYLYRNDVLTTAAVTGTVDLTKEAGVFGSSLETSVYDFDGDLGFVYFVDSLIDFSQEANRNLFVSQLGYPRDLAPLIADGTIPNPLIYLPFDDTANLGKNLGTGGDFTVNGTVASGADFNI